MKKTLTLVGSITALTCIGFIATGTSNKEKTVAAIYINKDVVKDYKYYKSINSDVVMVLHLADRSIPVMDSDEYFKTDIYGEYDSLGTSYLDEISNHKNMVIQGHSSKKNDLMFTSLKEYMNEEYFKVHKIIKIEYENLVTELEILGVLSVDLNSEEPYLGWYDTNYRNDLAMIDYIEDFKSQSILFNDEIEVKPEDKLVTLVTCDRRYEDARLVILAKEKK